MGTVAEIKNADGSPVSLSLVFTSVKLKDGKEIPVKATVIAAYPVLDTVATTWVTLLSSRHRPRFLPTALFSKRPECWLT